MSYADMIFVLLTCRLLESGELTDAQAEKLIEKSLKKFSKKFEKTLDKSNQM